MFEVLVTNAEERQGVIVIRSLGRRGIKMLVTGHSRNSVGFFSKYVSSRALLPSPMHDKAGFVEELLNLVKTYKIPFIYPVAESSLIALDERRSEIETVAKLIAPPSESIRMGLDKKLALETAEQQGVPTTKTLYPVSVEEAVFFAEQYGYPVILKPRGRSIDRHIPGSFNFKVLYVHNNAQLREILANCTDGIYPMMQEYAYGPHTQFNCFIEKGGAHSFFQDDAVRMLPLTGGVGTRMRSREVVPELAERSVRIFRAMNLEGCAQAQFKGPGKDGMYRFVEVSVRLPASVGSAVFSGIDFPWMQYQLFTGEPVDRANHYKIGQSTRWFRGDTLTVARYLVGDMQKSADRLPSKSRVLMSWLSDFVRPGLKNYVESFTDPVPGFFEFIQLVRNLLRLASRKILGK